MSCEFNGDLNSFRELEGYVIQFESSHPGCNDFKKLLKITRPDRKTKYDCVNRAVAGYLTYLKNKRDTDTSFKHFKDLSDEVLMNPLNGNMDLNGNADIDPGIFTNPIKTASFIKFCTVNDIKLTFGLDYHNMNINGKTDLFPTYRKFLNDYPFLNEVEGPIKYKLHLYYLLYGYMKQYCVFDYSLCYSHHLIEYYTNPNYLLSNSKGSKGSKGSKNKSRKGSKNKSRLARLTFKRKGFKGGAVRAVAGQVPGQGQNPGLPQGFVPVAGLGLSAIGQARAQQQGLTHTDRDAVERRSPLYIYIVNSPVYSALSVTSLTVAGAIMFGSVASFSSPFMADLLSTAGTLKKSSEMIVKEFPNEFDFIDLSKRGILATSSKLGAGLGAVISSFFIGAGSSGAFEDPRIVALPRISSGYLSGLWDRLRWRPSNLRRVKTRNINFTTNAKNMTNKESRGVYTQGRVDRLKAELSKFHLFIINDKFITDESVQQFRLLFKEYVWSSMCKQFEDRVNDMVNSKKMDIISGKRNDLQYVSFEHLAYERPPASGIGAEPVVLQARLSGQAGQAEGCVDPVLKLAMGELSPEEQFAANRRIAQSLGIDSVAKWKAMDHLALSKAQQDSMNTIKLSPEEIDQINHSCRQKVSELIVKTGEKYLQSEIRKGESGVEFYEACNDVLDLGRYDDKLRESVRSVASSVFIIEQNMNLVLPKKVTIPMSSLFLMMASIWSINDIRTGFLPYSRYMIFWHFTQIIMSMRTLALYYELATIVSIHEKTVPKIEAPPNPKNSAANPNAKNSTANPNAKNAKNATPNIPLEPEVEPLPDARLGPLLKAQIEANANINKAKSMLTKATEALRKAKIIADENMEEISEASQDVYDEVVKKAAIANQSLENAKKTMESAKQTVETATSNYKKIVEDVASITAETAKKAQDELARRIAEQASKKLKDQARRAAYEASKLEEEASRAAKRGKPESTKVLSKRYKELLKVTDYFHKGKKIEDIPKLLNPEKAENQLKIANRHMDLWKDGGEFFSQYTEEEFKEERNFRLLLERWIISTKRGQPGRVRLWLNKRYEKCSVIQDTARKAAEAAEAVRKAAEASRKAKEGTGSMFSRMRNAAAATAETVKESATFRIPTLDKCAEWYGAESYYKFYFSMISGIFYVLTNRKFYELAGRYLTQNASQEIMEAGIQILQVIGFGLYHGRTLTSTITLGLSLKSMFTTYSDFSRDMTSRTAGIETGLRPYKFEMSGINSQLAENEPTGGEQFRRHAERLAKVSEQQNRLQDSISKAIDDIRAKAEDARKAYDSQQKDYVVRLKEIESDRENARVVMEQKALEARQAELKLSEKQADMREKQLEFQKQTLELQQKQEERNARQEEASKEIERVKLELEREKIDISRSGQAQSEEMLAQAKDAAAASVNAIQERARLEDARLAMQEKALNIQASANEASLKNGANQITSLTETMGSLNNTIASALQSLTQHQERMVALQSGEGRQLHEQERIIGQMQQQIRDLNERGNSLLQGENLREASIISGLDNTVSEFEQRRRELNGLPNAPRGDPRIAANAGTGTGRKAIGVSNGKDAKAKSNALERAAKSEALKRDAEERARKALLSISNGYPVQALGSAGPILPLKVVRPFLGPAPPPISNANFAAPVPTLARTPPRGSKPFNAATFQAAAAAELSNSPINNASAFLKVAPVIDVDDNEVQLRQRLLKYNGVKDWRWDFTVESYEDYIVRTDALLNPNPSSEKDRRREAQLIARNAQNFSEFQEHEPGKKPAPVEPSKLKKYMSHFKDDEKLDAVKKFLDIQETKKPLVRNSRPEYMPSVSQLETLRQSRILALNRRTETEKERHERLEKEAKIATNIALLRSSLQDASGRAASASALRASSSNSNSNGNPNRGTRSVKKKGKGSRKGSP